MARILFVVPPLTGHVNPTVGVAAALTDAGHTVAWVGHRSRVGPLLPDGATLFALPEADTEDLVEKTRAEAASVRGLASIKFFVESFAVPLAIEMRAGVDQAVTEFAPDVVVVDQQAIAGGVVCRGRGVPWVTSCTTSAEILDPLEAFPKVAAWRRDALHRAQEAMGVADPVDEPGLSPHRVLVFSTLALVGSQHVFPPHYAFVGPVIHDRRPDVSFPWNRLANGPRILVSLGTVNADRSRRFYQVVAEAMAGAPWQTLLSAPAAFVPPLPPNVLRFDYVPQLQLLSRIDGVVSHGGHNTVCESLAAGVPLVVTPIKDDQPVVAQQVVDAGAGLRLSFGRLRPAALREAVARILDEPEFRSAARRVGDSFRSAGGGAAAAAEILALIER